MTPMEFADKWNRIISSPTEGDSVFLSEQFRLIRPDSQAVDNLNITQECKSFLIDGGLPKSAAPFLSFSELANFQRVWEAWDLAADWTEPEQLRLSRYLLIGSDGEGNPICIDEQDDGRIVILDHAAAFAPLMFMNSGVPQLAEFLLVYRNMIKTAQLENGEEAYIEGNIPKRLKQEAINEFELIDPDAIRQGCFWQYEIDSI